MDSNNYSHDDRRKHAFTAADLAKFRRSKTAAGLKARTAGFMSQSKLRRFKGMQVSQSGEVVKNGKIVLPKSRVIEELKKIYRDPKTGFIGRDKLLAKADERFVGVTKDMVSEFLKRYTTAQLHRPHERKSTAEPILIKSPLSYIQIDLVTSFWDLRGHNDGYRVILTAVDLNTRHAWARATKNKESATIAKALEEILDDIRVMRGKEVTIVQSDNGSEFQSEVAQLLQRRGIKQNFSKSHTPQSQGIIERFNGTIKRRIGAYMTDRNTKRWVDVLQDFVDNYNDTDHKLIKEKPNEMVNDPKKNKQGFNELQKHASRYNRDHQRKFPEIVEGGYVRVSLLVVDAQQRAKHEKNQRKDGSVQNWTADVFKVTAVHDQGQFIDKRQGIRKQPTYTVRNTNPKSELEEVYRSLKRDQILKTVKPGDEIGKPLINKAPKAMEIRADDPKDLREEKEAHNEKLAGESIASRLGRRNRIARELFNVKKF